MAAYTRKQYSGAARNTTTTTLLTNVGTTVDIAATTGWPSIAGIPFYVVINPSSIFEEKCLATISGSTLTLTRAQDDTTASEHQIGSVIYPVFTANDADEANELVSKLTTKGDLLVTDGTNLLRLGVGTEGYFLKASSSASAGVEWASIPTINSLNDIGDVTINDVEEGDFLVYKNSASAWINETIHFITVSDTEPTDEVKVGDLWYNSSELELYTYYSGSWIQVTLAPEFPKVEELENVYADEANAGDVLAFDGLDWYNDTVSNLLGSHIIALSGDVSGSVLFDSSASVNISTTIQPNSVALGTDTTGSYVQSLVAGTGVALSNNSGESATPTIAIGQAVGTSSSVSFAHVATDSLNVENNIIGNGNITLFPNISSYVVGDTGPSGGKIFITPSTSGNATGKYFEVAPIAGEVIRKWATDTDPGIGLGNAATTVVGADGTDIGTGQQNTADIVAQIGNVAATSAAVYCDEYSYGGFSDWFLPSKDELNELYVQRNVVGGLQVSYYSTSSEYSNDAFWFQSFIDGYPNTPYKNNAYYIRPVRSFVAPAPAGMITGNLTGNVTGNSSTATTLQTARTISLSGDVSGSVSFNGSADASISATIQPNSVALGTDTTGNYMSDLTQGTGVTITHTPSEGSNATIAIGQAVGTSASVTFANLTVTGDLTVSGTTTAINTTELMVDDNLVVLNSNVTAAPTENAGIEVERGSSANVSLRWNETSDKWEITEDGSAYLEIGTTADISAAALASLGDLPDVSTAYQIGATGPAGGIIFITPDTTGNSTGKYFEVAPSASQVQRSWATGGNQSLAVSGADATGFGFGAQNTIDIVAQSGNVSATSAAAYASGYEYGGFSDWFLPSIDELQELYAVEALEAGTIPGLLSNNYWSSTEYSATQAEYQNLGDGGQGFSAKSNSLYVRPVRAFDSPASGDFLKWNGSYWTNDPINLGTDTVGNFVNDITAGTGITVTHTPGEGSSASIALNATLDNLSDVVIASPIQFQGLMYDGTNWVNSNIPDTYLVRNNTGSTILKGTLVGAVGAEPSGRIDVAPFEVTGTENSELRAMGIVTSNISSGVNGAVMSFGTLTGLDTRGDTASALAVGDETWAAGDILFAHPTVAGKLTNIKPQHDLAVAFITVRHASAGQIAIRIIPGNNHLEWMHDVVLTSPTDGQFLRYNSASTVWVNDEINLGTDTVGDYMLNVSAGTGIAISHTQGEGSTASVSTTGVQSLSAKAGNYTLAVGDAAETIIIMDSSSANDLTVPSASAVSFTTGTSITVVQRGTGKTRILAGSGVSLLATPGVYLRARYSSCTLVKTENANEWFVIGDLAAS